MTNTNDNNILVLKKKIEVKREQLGEAPKFVPITNCSLEFNGVRTNIRTLTRQDAITTLINLNTLFLSAKDLNLEDDYILSGYKIKDWMDDIDSRLWIISYKEEEAKLKKMEVALDKLLTEEKQVELEIAKIAEMF